MAHSALHHPDFRLAIHDLENGLHEQKPEEPAYARCLIESSFRNLGGLCADLLKVISSKRRLPFVRLATREDESDDGGGLVNEISAADELYLSGLRERRQFTCLEAAGDMTDRVANELL
jgi:hypothetical protein